MSLLSRVKGSMPLWRHRETDWRDTQVCYSRMKPWAPWGVKGEEGPGNGGEDKRQEPWKLIPRRPFMDWKLKNLVHCPMGCIFMISFGGLTCFLSILSLSFQGWSWILRNNRKWWLFHSPDSSDTQKAPWAAPVLPADICWPQGSRGQGDRRQGDKWPEN